MEPEEPQSNEPSQELVPVRTTDDNKVVLSIDQWGEKLSAHKAVAEEVAAMIKAGLSLNQAEEKAHVTLHGPGANQKVKGALEKLLDWEMPAADRKRMVRARLNEIVVSGSDRDSVAAAKLVSDDPEVGIGPKPNTAEVNVINFSPETLELFRKANEREHTE